MAFGVVWHTNYTEFPDCTSTTLITRNTPVPTTYPPLVLPTPPDQRSCSYSGGGGNYLSNESAYRNTLLRDRMGLNIFAPSDSTFNAWRVAIVRQGLNLVKAVADKASGARSR